ncbi:MAG: hypothetical protein AB1705_11885 [Verrucomicrobiota bacterium]
MTLAHQCPYCGSTNTRPPGRYSAGLIFRDALIVSAVFAVLMIVPSKRSVGRYLVKSPWLLALMWAFVMAATIYYQLRRYTNHRCYTCGKLWKEE